ncbi:hypothetical protein [Bordetella holmesii]|uniref:hypothetical protein n=1 Tax=Bordetella holmesii TaxID=35814 RepID=UPI0039B39225
MTDITYHPNTRRLALSCRGIGSVLAADRGLVHERSDDPRTAINALLAAVWRRKPEAEVLVHSDQGSQFSSHDWQDS